MRLLGMICLAVFSQIAPANVIGWEQSGTAAALEKSAYFAFVDRDYIFTVEVVGPGVAILNFVSMADDAKSLPAKQIRMRLDTRTVVARFFLVDTGDPKQPITAPTVTMRPRSSFGVRIQGDLGSAKELSSVIIRLGDEDLRLEPVTSLAFENLVLKVNRINLGSPDFRDDWQILKLEVIGTRSPAARK
jgi:hypothetical protein